MYREVFPARIKMARESAGYTQRQVAKETNLGQSQIAKYETGKLEPSLETLGILAQFYNVDVNWLLGVVLEPTVKLPPQKKTRKDMGIEYPQCGEN